MSFVDVTATDQIATITINRPEALNALSSAVMDDLADAFDKVSESDARAIILTGAGEKAFIAGADIKEFAAMDETQALQYSTLGHSLTLLIEQSRTPVIAAVNGYALGGGCEIALACHIRIASDRAIFGQPEVSLGVTPGFGGTQRLPRIVGKGIALELLTTGRHIDATEAHRIGLVNKVSKAEELMHDAMDLASQICRQGPLAVAAVIHAVNEGLETTLEEGLSIEADLFSGSFTTSDFDEGTTAFLEKRPPHFKGE